MSWRLLKGSEIQSGLKPGFPNLLMNMTLPQLPGLSFLLPKKKKTTVFNDSKDSRVSSDSNQWTLSTGSLYPWWCWWQLCLATQVHHDDKFTNWQDGIIMSIYLPYLLFFSTMNDLNDFIYI